MAHIRRLEDKDKEGRTRIRWKAEVWHPSGKRYSKTDRLKRIVEQWAREKEASFRRRDFVDPSGEKMPLEKWREQWLRQRIAERSSKARDESQWRNHVAPQWERWPLGRIRKQDVQEWVAQVHQSGVGASTIAGAAYRLSALLEAAVEARLIGANPASGVKLPRIPRHIDRVLTDETEFRLLHAGFVYPFSTLIKTKLYTGLRWGEIAGLPRINLDYTRNRLWVTQVLDRNGEIKQYPKSAAGYRPVPLTEEVCQELGQLAASHTRDLVFGSAEGKPLHYSNFLKREWKTALAAAGLADPQPTPHDLRHTYGTWLAERGIPAHEIAALMGHASLRSVQRYIHAGEERMERAVKALTYSASTPPSSDILLSGKHE